MVVDPHLCTTIPKELTIPMALSSVAISIDALITMSIQGKLNQKGIKTTIMKVLEEVSHGLPDTILNSKSRWVGRREDVGGW